jgi:flagellar motor switch protein FliN/FliY
MANDAGQGNGSGGQEPSGYEPARFDRVSGNGNGNGTATAAGGLDAILDIPVEISVEIGRARMPISQLIKLAPGAVVELDRMAGEPLDVLANGRLVARGEVVVMNDRYGIRLTEVVGDGRPSEGE